MALSTSAKNLILDSLLQGDTIRVSLHTADPGTTGASEISGGGYARATVTFSLASNGSSSNSQQVVWTGMPASTITHCGVWRGSAFMFGVSLSQPRTLSSGDGFFFLAGTMVVQAA